MEYSPITNQKTRVSDLDFVDIKKNLINYFSGQEVFSDYEYEGSALSILMEVLAYNTHYNALYLNLAVNEMFLDSASKRASVLSIANNFAYVPRSARCSRAVVDVILEAPAFNAPSFASIPKYGIFSTNINGTRYVFYTLNEYTTNIQYVQLSSVSGTPEVLGYEFKNVEIYEGSPISKKFIVETLGQKFLIKNINIDLDTMIVIVQDNIETSEYKTYFPARDIIDIDSNSLAYFVKENEDGTYELSFGRNNFGVPIKPGNVVSITALESFNKDSADYGKAFAYQSLINGKMPVVNTVYQSTGGADKESVLEIKDNVTNAFFVQNRAVTELDYKSIIKRNVYGIDDVFVWGGEKNNPPVYGKVFVCVKPSLQYLSESEKVRLTEILNNHSIVTNSVVFTDPKYIELEISSSVYFDSNATFRSSNDIKNDILVRIESYRQEYLQKFNGIFRFSKFSSMIDLTDKAIRGNITTIKAYVEIDPIYEEDASYEFNILNPIDTTSPEESILSTGFYILESEDIHYIDDDSMGNLRLIKFKNINTSDRQLNSNVYKKIVKNKIGRVDYSGGYIKIDSLVIDDIEGDKLYFVVKLESNDVVSANNFIVDIPQNRVLINMISNPITQNTKDYKFTSSRK